MADLTPIPPLSGDTNKVQPLRRIWGSVDRYFSGPVNTRWLTHPALRWALTALLVIYLSVGAVVGWKVYKTNSESTNIRRILSIYPFPAVLMPQDVILVRDYLNQLKYIRHFAEKTKQTLPDDKTLRGQLISQLIDTRLLLHATEKYGVQVTQADIDAAYKKISDENGGSKELAKLLTDLYGMNDSEFRQLIRDQLLREKIQQDVLVQVHAKHILITDQKQAQSILDQVKKDPSKFDDLAKQYSQDTATRDKGGDLGYFGRGVMTPPFEAVAFKLKKGELSPDLVKSEFGYHIILVVDRKGTVDQTYTDFLANLRKNKKIWTFLK